MSSRPDLDRRIADWLDGQGVVHASDQFLAATRARLDVSRQRRVFDLGRSDVGMLAGDGRLLRRGRFEWPLTPRLVSVVLVVALVVAAMVIGSMSVGGVLTQRSPLPGARGTIVMTVGSTLVAVDPISGTTRQLAGELPQNDTPFDHVGVEFSPDGKRLLVTPSSGEGVVNLYLANADGGDLRALWPGVDFIGSAWAPDGGKIAALPAAGVNRGVGVNVSGRSLWVYDVESGSFQRYDLGIDIAGIEWRPNHDELLLFVTEEERGAALVRADGTDLRPISIPDGPHAWSADGSTIAYGGGDGRVHLLDIATGADRILTFEGSEGTSEGPTAFSPDGSKLLIKRSFLGRNVAPPGYPYCCREPWVEVVVPAAGGGPATVLGTEEHKSIGGPGGSGMFSPDGKQVLAVYTQDPAGAWMFDPETGKGERQTWWSGGDVMWLPGLAP
ncbi:MAG TPA: hypothetical protein VFV72_09120 [Candidatus Limnocylindrales bacterium]|nr:hypothetical protein [Candidatus Limnocylindrales bacterium]